MAWFHQLFSEFSAPPVDRLRRNRDVQALLPLLQYKSDFHGSVFDDAAIETARRYAAVRAEAATALGEIGDNLAVDPLLSALRDMYGNVRAAAAAALGRFGDKRAVEPLLQLFEEEKEDAVREAAGDALLRIGPPAVVPLVKHILGRREQYAGSSGTLVQLGAAAVEPLISELAGNSDGEVREHAARVLAEIKDPRAIPELSKALRDASHDVRNAAATALSSFEYSPSTEQDRAAYAVAREEWNMAVDAGRVAVEPLLVALSSERDNVREEAVRALGQISDSHALEALIEALGPFRSPRTGDMTYSPGILEAVIDALRQIGHERAVAPLAKLARENDWMAQAAVSALQTILSNRLTAIDDDALRSVAELDHIRQKYTVDGDYVVPVGGETDVDCSDIREIARQELVRRATHRVAPVGSG